MKHYYIACVDECYAPYYYHNDKKFYWNMLDGKNVHVKYWKTLKAARNTFNSIKLKDNFRHLSILCDDIQEGGAVVTTCIEEKI